MGSFHLNDGVRHGCFCLLFCAITDSRSGIFTLSGLNFHDKQPSCSERSLTHILAHLIKKIFKRELTVEKLSQMVQRIWSGRREDWCLRCKPLSRTGPGSNQRPTTHPSSVPPPSTQPLDFLSLFRADRWASLCISAMHFLKPEKPIHLGQMQKRGWSIEKLQNAVFFSFFYSLQTLKCHSLPPCIPSSPPLIVLLSWLHLQRLGRLRLGSSLFPSCTVALRCTTPFNKATQKNMTHVNISVNSKTENTALLSQQLYRLDPKVDNKNDEWFKGGLLTSCKQLWCMVQTEWSREWRAGEQAEIDWWAGREEGIESEENPEHRRKYYYKAYRNKINRYTWLDTCSRPVLPSWLETTTWQWAVRRLELMDWTVPR